MNIPRPGDECPRRNGGLRGISSQPTALIAAKHTTGCRAQGQVAVRRECDRKYRADDHAAGLRHPAPPSIVRAQDSEIGAGQQVGRIARIDRNDKRGIEKQPDIGILPGGA